MSFVIGTAGHIDHGKSTLITELTGIDPDRLAEEKRRGMTIDLGFAHLRLPSGLEVGIVDVPGHARFIRNMLAGTHGLDAVMLVIAADEGVMPQTREHLEIIDLLDVRRGVVVLSKVDLVDEEWLNLVTSEVLAALKQSRRDRPKQELATALSKIATDSAPSGKVSGAQPNLLWQATFLVPRAKRKQWDRVLKNFVERWNGQRRIGRRGPATVPVRAGRRSMALVEKPSGEVPRVQKLHRAGLHSFVVPLVPSEELEARRIVADVELGDRDLRLLEARQRRHLARFERVRKDLVEENGRATAREQDVGFSVGARDLRVPRLRGAQESVAQLVGGGVGVGRVK